MDRQICPEGHILASRGTDLSIHTLQSESEKFTGDTSNDIISPGGSDGGEISPLNARVKRTGHTFIRHFSRGDISP